MSIRLTDPYIYIHIYRNAIKSRRANLARSKKRDRRREKEREVLEEIPFQEFEISLFDHDPIDDSLSRTDRERNRSRLPDPIPISMNNNEWPDHLWVTTFFSRTSWTFYALTHFDQHRSDTYTYERSIRSDRVCSSFSLLSFGRKVYQACIRVLYVRVPLCPLVATRHFSPPPRRSVCGRPRNKERKNKVRLHSIDSARSSVSSLLEREKEEATSIKGFSRLVCHDRSVIYTWRVTSRSIFAPVTFLPF